MRLLTACGGVRATVVEERMQRGPVLVLDDAARARDFGQWAADNVADIVAAAETTTRFGRLRHIGQYPVGPSRFLRFNYTTGDAAGQNMAARPRRPRAA